MTDAERSWPSNTCGRLNAVSCGTGSSKRSATFWFSSSAIRYGKRMAIKKAPLVRPAVREVAERLGWNGVLNSPTLTSNLRAGPGGPAHRTFFPVIRVLLLCVVSGEKNPLRGRASWRSQCKPANGRRPRVWRKPNKVHDTAFGTGGGMMTLAQPPRHSCACHRNPYLKPLNIKPISTTGELNGMDPRHKGEDDGGEMVHWKRTPCVAESKQSGRARF